MKETPYELFEDDQKKKLGKNNKAKMTLYNALPRKELGISRGNSFGNKGGESSKPKGACYNCGIEGHFASKCRKPKENKAFVGGTYRDSEDNDEHQNDATYLMEIDSHEAYDGGHIVFGSNLKGKVVCGVEDDKINESIVQDLNGSPSLQVYVSDECSLKSLKEARGYTIEQVNGDLNERTLSLKQQLNTFALVSGTIFFLEGVSLGDLVIVLIVEEALFLYILFGFGVPSPVVNANDFLNIPSVAKILDEGEKFFFIRKCIKFLIWKSGTYLENLSKYFFINGEPFLLNLESETLAEGTEGGSHLGPERPRVYSDLSPEEKDRCNADIRAINILLQGLPKDIYTLINHYTNAKDIWDNVKMLLEGLELTKEDWESQLGQENNPRGGGAAGYEGAQNRVENANIDKILLMQAQKNEVALDEEQLLFLAGGQDNAIDEDVDEQHVHDLALNVDNMFQADNYDAFDSDVDEAPTVQTMFMANLSSADPVYDEADRSYDSNILYEVHDHDHYQDAVCEHHEEHEMHDNDNAVLGVQSNVSSVRNDAYMMIYNDMYELHAQSVSKTSHNTVVDNSLTAELATYKEQVELYKRWDRFELTEREQKIDEQLRIVITDRNFEEKTLKKELHSVKLQLSSTITHYKSMVEEVTSLKKDFKQNENKYLEELLDMKSLKEKFKDRLYKQD
nr:hypothetical protein [Tanacetum cinerariifolium]